MKVFFIQYKRLPRVGRSGFVVESIVVGFKSFLFVTFLIFFRGSGVVSLCDVNAAFFEKNAFLGYKNKKFKRSKKHGTCHRPRSEREPVGRVGENPGKEVDLFVGNILFYCFENDGLGFITQLNYSSVLEEMFTMFIFLTSLSVFYEYSRDA